MKQRYRDKSSRVQRDEVLFLPHKLQKGFCFAMLLKDKFEKLKEDEFR
jgi:hypothetical protein